MERITIKELRITLKVLEQLGNEVPDGLFVHISDMIRDREAHRQARRCATMTDEQLERLDNRRPTRLRVTTADGRIVHHKRNELTFMASLQLVPPELLRGIDFCIGRRKLFYVDPTEKRVRHKGYKLLSPGLFVRTGFSVSEQAEALRNVSNILLLQWHIEVL